MRLKKTYSSREVAALTGLTARQLQLWDAGGLLSPTIPSHKTDAGGYTERRYTPIELFELLVLADLRQRHLRAHSEWRVLQSAEDADATAARHRKRGTAEGIERKSPGEEEKVERSEGGSRRRAQRIGKIFSRSSAGRGMTC